MTETKNQEDITKNQTRQHTTNLLMNETSISVQFTGIMSAAILFVIALLMTNYRSELAIPLIYLFISMFGFLYSTLIYANASGQLARLNRLEAEKILSVGNVVSEYFGVYYTIFAFPIAFFALTKDLLLSSSILIVDIIGFLFYHCYGYSIMERYCRRKRDFWIIIFVFSTLLTSNYIFHVAHYILSISYLPIILTTGLIISGTLVLTIHCLELREI